MASFETVNNLLTSWTAIIVLAAVAFLVVVIFVVRTLRQPRYVNEGIRAVFITGCDSGFGYMTAKRLDALGFKVFAACLNAQGESAKRLEDETSPKLQVIQLDVTKEEEIEAARMEVTESLMGNVLWAVINNAGVASHADFEWFPASDFNHLMDVNFMGVVRVTRAFLPLIRAAKGRIINIASMAGRTAMPGFAAYSASKSAVIGFTESLRREMEHFEVKVIAVEPALYKTGFAAPEKILPQNERYWEKAEPGIKRDYGEPFFKATQKSQESLLKWANPKVGQVADCLVHAVRSRHPLPRYVPPSYMRLLNDLMNVTFCGVQDKVIRMLMGVNSKPAIVNPLLNADTGRMGRRRSHAT